MAPSKQREREIERARRERQAARRAEERRQARRRNGILGAGVATAVVIAAVVLIGLHLAGGSSSNGRTVSATSPSTAPSAASPTPSGPFPSLPPGADPRLGTKPSVTVPKHPAKQLVVKDLIRGKGAVAKTGDTLTVNYVGLGTPSGKEFDSSWSRRQPFTFVLGKGQVIKGWDRGLVGMRVGGRRELVIPASLAYGANGQPPTIQPNETLVFVIDLLAVK